MAGQLVDQVGQGIKPSIGATLLHDHVQIGNEQRKGEQFGGAVVVDIAKNGPAKKAGLKGLDKENGIHHIITAVNGQRIHGKRDFYAILLSKVPGDVLHLTVRDNVEGTETVMEIVVSANNDVKYSRSRRKELATP